MYQSYTLKTPGESNFDGMDDRALIDLLSWELPLIQLT